MNVAIVKYNAGNIRSVDFALRRLGVSATVTDNHEAILAADRVIFPGVGEASTTMAYLQERKLDALLKSLQQPVLGICLGQQLMCRWSEEGDTSCIGIFGEDVLKFPARGKVPHMGWNQLIEPKGDLFRHVESGEFVYFVHSYYVPQGPHTIAGCEYITGFSAALQFRNFFATQFHPEKSGPAGRKILENFLEL